MIKVKILDDDCRFPHPGRRANSRNVRSRRALSGVKEFHKEVEEEEEAFLSQEVVDRGREWFFEKDNQQGILGSAMERRPVGGVVVVARESSVKLTAERQDSEMSYGRRSKSGVMKVSPSCARNEEAGETASLELEPQPKQLASVEGGSRKAVANPYQLKRRRMLVDSDDGDYADPFEGKEEEKDTPDVGDVTGNRKGVGIRAKSNGGLPSEQYSTGLGNKQVNGQLIKQEITTGVKRHGNVVTKISTTQSFDSPKKREKTRNLNVGVGVRNSRSHETVNGHFDHAGCETDKKKVRGQGSNLVMGHGSNGSGRLLKTGLPDRLCVGGKLTNETHCMHKDGSLEHLGRSEVELNRAKLQCCEVESNGFNSSKLQLEKTGNGLREIIEAEKGTKQSSLFKDREISTSISMKHLIAAAQAKRQARTLAVSSVPLNLEVGRLGCTNLSNLSPPRSQLRASPIQGTHKDLSQENERLTDGYTQSLRIPVDTAQHSGMNLWAEWQTSPYQPVQGEMLLSEDTEVSVARDALQGMLETLSGTKDCIARVTRHALECVKFGIAEQVIQLIVKKLETEPSFGHRVDIFFLVDSITQCSYQTKGAAALSYIPAVQMMLPRLLDAAAPPGPSAKENRRQCLRVLKIWLDRSIMPEKALKDFIHRLESQRDEAIDEGVLSHCPPSECALNRPIYKIEGVFVDEYGSNAHCSGPGLSLSWLCDDEEKLFKEKREEKETSWTDAGHRGTDKYRHVLQAVDGELEMEDECPNLDGIEYGWNSYEKAQVTPEDSLCATHAEVDDLPLLPFEPCPPNSPPPLPPPLPSSPPPSPPPLPPSPPPLLLPSPPPPDTMVFAIPVPSCDAYPLCNPLQSTELPFQTERESANHTDMPILGSPPESLSTAIEEKLSHPHLPSYSGNQAMKLSSTYSSSPGLRGNPLPLGIAITPSHYYPVMTQMPPIAHPLPSSSAYRPSHAFRNPQASFQKGKPSSSKERWHIL